MNKTRRAALKDVIAELERAVDRINTARDDEQLCYDNLPESLQEAERGCGMEASIDSLEEAVESLEEAISSVRSAIA